MFEQVDRELSFGSWTLQLVVAFCGPIILLVILDTWLDVQDTLLSQILSYVGLGIAGFVLALLISAISPQSRREGTLIWMLPTALEVVATIWQLVSRGT